MASRRDALSAVGTLAAMPAVNAVAATTAQPVPPGLTPPRCEFVMELLVDVAETRDLGAGPLARRRIVPITGGTFSGPRIRGKVLAGGADRQLIRADGVRLLNALYEIETDDGAVITINNNVLIEDYPAGGRYAFSHIDVTAPAGPYGWLNNRVFVGTLQSLRPNRAGVRIGIFSLI